LPANIRLTVFVKILAPITRQLELFAARKHRNAGRFWRANDGQHEHTTIRSFAINNPASSHLVIRLHLLVGPSNPYGISRDEMSQL